jgi:hypothetical protein
MKNKLWIWIAVVMLGLIGNISLYAGTCRKESVRLTQKIYLSADQIRFANGAIYFTFDNYTYETPAIFSDEKGYYIEEIAKSGNCSWKEWQCEVCGFCNLRLVDWECRRCGFSISH